MEPLIYLCGFMGTGKTETGKVLAKRLRRRFVDLDALIMRREKKPIKEIFANGENKFRAAETRALKSVKGPAVVALGGGALLRNKVAGTLVRLTCSEPELWRRLKPELEKRPLLKRGRHSLKKLLKSRKYPGRPFSTTRRTPAQAAALIEKWLKAS